MDKENKELLDSLCRRRRNAWQRAKSAAFHRAARSISNCTCPMGHIKALTQDQRARIPVRAADRPLRLFCRTCVDSFWVVFGIEEIKKRFDDDERLEWQVPTTLISGDGDERAMGYHTDFACGQHERRRAAKQANPMDFIATVTDESNSSCMDPRGQYYYETTSTHRPRYNRKRKCYVWQNYPVWTIKLTPASHKATDPPHQRNRDYSAIYAIGYRLLEDEVTRLGLSYQF